MRLALGFGFLMLVTAGTAPVAAAPSSSCVPDTSLVSPERAISFLEHPEALLNRYKDGQGGLASEIRDLLMIRPETVEGIASLAKASSPDQSRAIGAGLGTAASVCALTQRGVAQDIQKAVLKTDNADLMQAFAAITNDISTEATTGATATGETTAGGGQDSSSTGRATGAATTTETPFLTATSGSTAQTFTAAVSASATSVLTSVSPSR